MKIDSFRIGFFLLAVTSVLTAQNIVTIEPSVGQPGTSNNRVTITIIPYDDIAGIEFKIEDNPNVLEVLYYEAHDLLDGWNVSVIDDGSVVHVLIWSFGQVIYGDQGYHELITLIYDLDDDAEGEISLSFALLENGNYINLSDSYGDPLSATTEDGTMIITNNTWPTHIENGTTPSSLLSSAFGPRVVSGYYDFHRGIDIASSEGWPVYATSNGTVVKRQDEWTGPGFGKYVIIEHSLGDFTYYSMYAHLNTILVIETQEVGIGQQIGEAGSTGTTAYHLHFSILDAEWDLDDDYPEENCLQPLWKLPHEDLPYDPGNSSTYQVVGWEASTTQVQFEVWQPGDILDCLQFYAEHRDEDDVPLEIWNYNYENWGQMFGNPASGLDDDTPDIDVDGDEDLFIEPIDFQYFHTHQKIKYTLYLENTNQVGHTLFLTVMDDDFGTMWQSTVGIDPTDVLVDEVPELSLPIDPSITTIYPNPFNSTISINYYIPPQMTDYQIKIFNILGELILSQNYHQEQSLLYQSFQWDGRDIKNKEAPSGTYLFQLVAGNAVKTKKLTLLK